MTPIERTVVDQMGRSVSVPERAQRIVSLVPSQTELLFDMGLAERVVGVTRYCLHPDAARQQCAVIGGTKRFDYPAIMGLQPDLIIGNKEENYQEGIDKLASGFPVWMSDIETLKDARTMISGIGEATGEPARANAVLDSIDAEWLTLPSAAGQSVLYMIWQKPFMGVATGTFVHDVLLQLGFQNCLANDVRYPKLSGADLAQLSPDVVMLSSEPFPFVDEHLLLYQTIFPDASLHLVDGEMFSWYGSRLRSAPAYFSRLLETLPDKTGALA